MFRVLRNFVAGLVLIAWASSASAASAWYVVDVDMTGVSASNSLLVKLSHVSTSPAFSEKWFRIPDISGNEMLATSLAAITAGLRLTIRVDVNDGSIPILSRLFVQK